MSNAVSPSNLLETTEKMELNPRTALLAAWVCWWTLLTIPFLVFLSVIWRQMYLELTPAPQQMAHRWFIFAMAFLGVSVPLAFFAQGRAFRAYWQGQAVEPRKYLRGMITIWMSLEFSGLVALFGCWYTNTLLPNMLPAILAFMLFVPLWPNGHAMSRPLVNESDPADYEEPR